MDAKEPRRGVYAQLEQGDWDWVQERASNEDRSVASIVRQGIRLLRRVRANMPAVAMPTEARDE